MSTQTAPAKASAARTAPAALVPLDAVWSMQHIQALVATLRRDPGAGGTMLVHRTAFAFVMLTLASLPACARSVQVKDYDDAAPKPAPELTPVMLDVENHNWADVVLYVLHDGRQTRLTQVSAAHDVSIEIPPQLQGEMGIIKLAVRRIGGRDSYISDSISLRGGPSVRLTIESNIGRSSVGVW